MQVLSKSLAETQAVAHDFVQKLGEQDRCQGPSRAYRQAGLTVGAARVVGLRGDLGSGKTTFLQAVARELGVESRVTSPTFVIEQVYDISQQQILPARKYLVHYDCYRLKNAKELEKLDWQKRLEDKSNLIFLEWPEIVKEILPPDTVYLDFKFINENTRQIEYK